MLSKIHKIKIAVLIIGIICSFGVISARLLYIAFTHKAVNEDYYQGYLPQRRANIVDRNGVILATTLTTASLYVDAKKILNPKIVARQLHNVFTAIPYRKLYKKLTSQKSFVWIKRHLTPKEQLAVNKLGIAGVFFQPDQSRIYPNKRLFSHILGYLDIDGKGIAGIEKFFDSKLTLQTELRLSLDIRVQSILFQELHSLIKTYHALSGAGIVLDVNNCEILGITSLPDFDPHNPIHSSNVQRFNNATLGVYELGSVMKIFTLAAALDTNKITLADSIYIAGPLRIDEYTIHDYHQHKNTSLTISGIFTTSSNIGMVHIAEKLGKNLQRKYLEKMGLFSPLSLEIYEKASPILPKIWRDSTSATISYGYGLAITPVHLVQAAAAMVNGGIFRSATLLSQKQKGVRVIRTKTSQQIRELLRLVVEKGTGKRAAIKGYDVGGKTGSANKVINGKYYKNNSIVSFVGIFPIHTPRYLVFTMLDTPHKNSAKDKLTGGSIVAPAVKNIISKISPILDIYP